MEKYSYLCLCSQYSLNISLISCRKSKISEVTHSRSSNPQSQIHFSHSNSLKIPTSNAVLTCIFQWEFGTTELLLLMRRLKVIRFWTMFWKVNPNCCSKYTPTPSNQLASGKHFLSTKDCYCNSSNIASRYLP